VKSASLGFGSAYPGAKTLGHEDEHSSASNIESNNKWSYTSTFSGVHGKIYLYINKIHAFVSKLPTTKK
jgi:hypothetical protein